MNRRLELHNILCNIVNITESDGDSHVYFQAPSTKQMKYPAIRYEIDDIINKYADNGVHLSTTKYSITVIDKDPDSLIRDKVARIPTCRFVRHYVSDNLNHDVFTIY